MSSNLFSLEKENVNPESLSSLVFRNQYMLFSQIIDERYTNQIQAIEDRTSSFIDNLMNTKNLILDSFPKEMLNLTVESFFEEFDGKFENILKEKIRKMGILEKSQLNNKPMIIKEKVKNLEKIPEYVETERQNFEECVMFTEKKNETIKSLKSPTFSKIKFEFSEKSDGSAMSKMNVLMDKSMKKPWVP
jgi:hypothetical protein